MQDMISILSGFWSPIGNCERLTLEIGPAKKVFAICAEMYYILRTSVSGPAEESEGFFDVA